MRNAQNGPDQQNDGENPTPTSKALQQGALVAVAFVALMGAVWGLGHAAAQFRVTQAENQLQKGFAALAAETLEPSRLQLAHSQRGCQALVDAYAGARRSDRLEWASQACTEAGFTVLARVAQAPLPPTPSPAGNSPGQPSRGLASPQEASTAPHSSPTIPRSF